MSGDTRDAPLRCESCGERWTVRVFYESGRWFYEDEDETECPACGGEGDEA